jgi:hypothetical protein
MSASECYEVGDEGVSAVTVMGHRDNRNSNVAKLGGSLARHMLRKSRHSHTPPIVSLERNSVVSPLWDHLTVTITSRHLKSGLEFGAG